MEKLKSFGIICLTGFLLLTASTGNVFAQGISISGGGEPKSAAPTPVAADILKASMIALGNLSSVEYEVKMSDDRPVILYGMGSKVRANTKLTVANSPLRAFGKLQGYDGTTYENFVLNDHTMRYSSAGKTGEFDTTKSIQPLMGFGDLNNTWRLLLDHEFFAKMIEGGRILYAGQDYIEDDLCNIVLKVNSIPAGSSTTYYWFSAKTNLPRAMQTLVMDKNGKRLLPQRTISISKINPEIAPAAFDYKPTEKDSVAALSGASTSSAQTSGNINTDSQPTIDSKTIQSLSSSGAITTSGAGGTKIEKEVSSDDKIKSGVITSLIGKPLPDLFADDLSFQKVRLADVVKKPTLITFWATWCEPCVKEMPAFQKFADKYKDKFQVVAIASGDTRADAVGFINKHPEYKFVFLIDPDWDKPESYLKQSLGVVALPTNLLVDANGKIVNAWLGDRNAEEWADLIDKLIAK